MTTSPLVGIVMGSDSDLPIMQETAHILDELGVSNEVIISSAHRHLIKLQITPVALWNVDWQ